MILVIAFYFLFLMYYSKYSLFISSFFFLYNYLRYSYFFLKSKNFPFVYYRCFLNLLMNFFAFWLSICSFLKSWKYSRQCRYQDRSDDYQKCETLFWNSYYFFCIESTILLSSDILQGLTASLFVFSFFSSSLLSIFRSFQKSLFFSLNCLAGRLPCYFYCWR